MSWSEDSIDAEAHSDGTQELTDDAQCWGLRNLGRHGKGDDFSIGLCVLDYRVG